MMLELNGFAFNKIGIVFKLMATASIIVQLILFLNGIFKTSEP